MRLLTMLSGKLHQATVTQCDLNYEGSMAIDADLLELAGILPNEQIDVYNINNGARLTTYAIAATPGSGFVGLNGAAARHAMPGDRVIVASYVQLDEAAAATHEPKVVLLDERNRPAQADAPTLAPWASLEPGSG